jgi:pyruvate-formate lyase-activating enzyme
MLSGGVTLSGGEPLMQADFSAALFRNLRGMHRTLQTSGYANPKHFKKVLAEPDNLELREQLEQMKTEVEKMKDEKWLQEQNDENK